MDPNALITALVTLLVGGSGGGLLVSWRKGRAEAHSVESNVHLESNRQSMEALQATIATLREELNLVRGEFLETRRENEAFRQENLLLRNEVASLRLEVAVLLRMAEGTEARAQALLDNVANDDGPTT